MVTVTKNGLQGLLTLLFSIKFFDYSLLLHSNKAYALFVVGPFKIYCSI